MSLKKFMSNNASYHSWATQKFVEWLSSKPDELLHKVVPSSFDSIIKTLNHIWSTDEYWYAVIAEVPQAEQRYEAMEFNTKEILTSIANRAKEISKLINSYSDIDLTKVITVESQWFQSEAPKYEYLQHLIIHATYHRGQIVTMGRNIGITDGSMTDYNFYNANIKKI